MTRKKVAIIKLKNGVVSWFDYVNLIYLTYLRPTADVYDDMSYDAIKQGIKNKCVEIIEGDLIDKNVINQTITVEIIQRLIDQSIYINNANDTSINYSKINHVHKASHVLFDDGQTFQDKLNLNTLKGNKGDKGDKGVQGDKGDKGDRGIGIKNMKLENNNLYITLDNDNATILNAGTIDLSSVADKIYEQSNQIQTLSENLYVLKEKTVSLDPFGSYEWKIEIPQTRANNSINVDNTKLQQEALENPELFEQNLNLGKYELYAVRTTSLREYENYYNTLIPINNDQINQVRGKELAQVSSSLSNAKWEYDFDSTISLDVVPTTQLVFVILKRH